MVAFWQQQLDFFLLFKLFPLLLLLSGSCYSSADGTSSDVVVVPSGPTVAVIGCGPSGMFFLHALAEKRKELEEKGDVQGLLKLPQVTVFEKSSQPGGVWRSDRNRNPTTDDDDDEAAASDNKSSNMYDGLWINSHKEGMEFFDYTYEEHFQSEPQPAYLPRQQVLEYIMARVAKHGNIMKDVYFNTTVTHVDYDESIRKFVVTTTTTTTTGSVLQEQRHYFDKCIWAAGMNGFPMMVPSILDKLGNFTGQIVHSTAMDKLASPESNAVRGKRILLIGDSSSAEDLALQSIKLGADKVFFTAQYCEGSASVMGAWPFDKVESIDYAAVRGVKGINSNTITFQSTVPGIPQPKDAEDIDIIIFCTGYKPAINMLSDALNPWPYSGHYKDLEEGKTWSLDSLGIDPKEWKMKGNIMTPLLGDIEPSPTILANFQQVLDDLYRRRLLIRNPNMMFIFETTTHPLLEIDVAARMCLAFITGELVIPTVEEMIESNRLDVIESMDNVYKRVSIDENYFEAFYGLDGLEYHVEDKWEELHTDLQELAGLLGFDQTNWGMAREMLILKNNKNETITKRELVKEGIRDIIQYEFRYLAREMKDINYSLDFGDWNAIDKQGKHLLEMKLHEEFSRLDLDITDAKEKPWITYRDMDPTNFKSIITGMGSTKLKGKWVEIDDEGNLPNGTNNKAFCGSAVTAAAARGECPNGAGVLLGQST